MAKRRVPRKGRSTTARDRALARRVTEVEEIARANRRELELQFRRMADIQAQLDRLKRRLE